MRAFLAVVLPTVAMLAAWPHARLAAQGPTSAAVTVIREPKWEIEFFGGGLFANRPTGGAAALPAPGTTFTTVNGTPSRYVPSWYFGDGVLLLNQANAALGVSQRITPLDGVLTSSIAARQGGGSIGMRVSRVITPRLTAEITVEYGPGLAISRAALDGIETSRVTFLSAWNGFFATSPFQNVNVSSVASTAEGGHQLLTTGALNVSLRRRGKIVPYVTVGGGLASSVGATPTTTIVGKYAFTSGGAPFSESDSTALRHVSGPSLVGVFGGGVKYHVTPRWGVRLDARMYVGPNTIDNVVDTTINLVRTPGSPVAWGNSPAVQFNNSLVTSTNRGSLSDPRMGFRTFAGADLQSQLSITSGVFWRFRR